MSTNRRHYKPLRLQFLYPTRWHMDYLINPDVNLTFQPHSTTAKSIIIMKNILMIAFHFPPIKVSSGIQRTLKFSQYLLDHHWRALILTAHPRAYNLTNNDQTKEIPAQVIVKRAFALDTAKHLAFKGRYVNWMALPDRWVSWCIGGVWSGLGLIRKHNPKIIFSTYPIASAHLLALILHRLTKLPWIADFRDSMTEDNYPTNPLQRKLYRWIEHQTVTHCSRAIFTTPSAINMYRQRYPNISPDKWAMIANGYDEENFTHAEQLTAYITRKKTQKPSQLVLLHSGALYPSERDPSQFFQALADMQQAKKISANSLKIILRATGHDALYAPILKTYNLQNIVHLEPNMPYETALAEMLVVDGLLIFQAANCNHQIPAKIYEYLRAKRPILAFTDSVGDTATVLREAGLCAITPLDDKDAITIALTAFLEQLKNQQTPMVSDAAISLHSRQARSQLLARLCDDVYQEHVSGKIH